MVKDGKLQEMLNGNISMSADTGTNFQDTNKSMADNDTDKEYSSYNEEDFLDEEND